MQLSSLFGSLRRLHLSFTLKTNRAGVRDRLSDGDQESAVFQRHHGVAAAPVMLLLMLITANKRVMGEFTVKGWLRGLGWLGTGVMALAAAAMFATLGK